MNPDMNLITLEELNAVLAPATGAERATEALLAACQALASRYPCDTDAQALVGLAEDVADRFEWASFEAEAASFDGSMLADELDAARCVSRMLASIVGTPEK